MSEHIARVYRNCYYQLRQICRIKRSLTTNSILVLAPVHSWLDYCNSVLYSLPWLRLQLWQSVLNSAARMIRGLKRFDHISPVLIELHWLPYPQRVKYKVCMVMFNNYCLKALAPAYLVALCTKGSSISGWSALRSAVCGDLIVPSHRTDWGLRASAVAGHSCLNELPVELRDLTVGPATFRNTWRRTRSELIFFWWSTHSWFCVTFCRVRYQVQ